MSPKAKSVLSSVVARSGMSKAELSRSMGKNGNYLSVVLNRGSVPQADTFSMIADASGYDMLVRRRDTGEEILIDPPEK